MNIKSNYCGYITIIGKVNVGKSTLLNQIIEKKISIVSRKKNTTQKNIIGIKTQDSHQCIYIDTPGIVCNNRNNSNKDNKNNIHILIKNTTLIIFIIDRIYWTKEDEIILNKIKKNNIPIIILINKIDKILNKEILLPFIDFLKKKISSTEIIPISAKKIKDIIFLNKIIKSYLPKTKHLYPKNWITTNSKFFTISEIIREQLIFFLGDELPSIVKVTIESFHEEQYKKFNIRAIIWVKNNRQKRIVIGHNGEKIKKISTISRYNIEKEFHIKTCLILWVKN
ncbi:GTPase Era [Buchnera aphidicola]|uniref:GTPase Era n=1 Tax=Buchnera aphidicola (Artemisaphis artemisicola) TaxID=1241836 RepID=A0A4D6XKM4_9GAMM|nr:GTPase Era [Buchnera aphidicola]QCI15937.1 GTPase Era [Buchnera aphidicola (Artemisaphis artemisicola)]